MKQKDRYFSTLAKHIEAGTYFEDARNWYATKYITPSNERYYSLALIAASITLMIYCFGVMLSFLPISKSIPITVEVSDLSSEYSRLLPLLKANKDANTTSDPDTSVQLYLAERYTTAREAYDSTNEYALLERSKHFIRTFSNKQIADTFERGLSIRNPNSPILRFRKHTTRTVDIDSTLATTRFINSPRKRSTRDGRPLLTYRADIPFTTTEQSKRTTIRQNWNATIDFLYSPVTYNADKEDFDKMEFSVINYQVSERN